MIKPKRVPQKWIRNAADERAVRDGHWFDEKRAEFTVTWIQENCRLYEGDRAGEPLELRDWQLDVTLRMFGWVGWSDRWGRCVRRFRKAGIWVPKKNKKSPTLAAWGLYLFAGDGEMGQKCFSTAKDGKQAMISHRHAMEMTKMSPNLRDECDVHEGTGRIVHRPTRSFYTVLTGDNREGQEGINGSLLVDETHVVDRRLADVIRRAGISRSEPLHIEVSTAGCDPDGYGKERFDYGERVNSGEFLAPEFLHSAYCAPQETSPESLRDRKEVIRLGKLANPAWGHTIDEKEFLSDYSESSATRSQMLKFMMYRLNIWLHSSNPWLSLDSWNRCKRDFSLDDLRGQVCYAGLDMASVRDLNALCLCFPQPDDTFKMLWWFWLPEETARQKNHLAPFVDWSHDRRSNLTLTAGSAVHHEVIVRKFIELSKVVAIQQLWFDEAGAEWASRAISEGLIDAQGTVLLEGANIERIKHRQSNVAFHEPTEKFESLVLSEKLHHNGDPLMSWQMAHAMIELNEAGHKKPVKPDGKDGVKKVDGVIAGIQALSGATKAEMTHYVGSGEIPFVSL